MLLVLGIEALLGVALSLVRRPSATEKQARVEIRAKKIELRRKRDPSLFVEASKLERRIIALEKSLAASKASIFGVFAFRSIRGVNESEFAVHIVITGGFPGFQTP